jgi:hypothetical protein
VRIPAPSASRALAGALGAVSSAEATQLRAVALPCDQAVFDQA